MTWQATTAFRSDLASQHSGLYHPYGGEKRWTISVYRDRSVRVEHPGRVTVSPNAAAAAFHWNRIPDAEGHLEPIRAELARLAD